jgi:uncharacterized protein
MQASWLNDNLVVLFCDYITGRQYFSFLGRNAISKTTRVLLEYSKDTLGHATLQLLPETVAANLSLDEFHTAADRDTFDYIYSTESLAALHVRPTSQCYSSRFIRRFSSLYPDHCIICSPLCDANMDNLMEIYRIWADRKRLDYLNSNEYKAFVRLISSPHDAIQALCIHVGGIIAGFSLFENVSSDCAMAHFCKANTAVKGIYEVMNWRAGKRLLEQNVQYLNFEQDLGIPNLRSSKEKYGEHTFLKKFTVGSVLPP